MKIKRGDRVVFKGLGKGTVVRIRPDAPEMRVGVEIELDTRKNCIVDIEDCNLRKLKPIEFKEGDRVRHKKYILSQSSGTIRKSYSTKQLFIQWDNHLNSVFLNQKELGECVVKLKPKKSAWDLSPRFTRNFELELSMSEKRIKELEAENENMNAIDRLSMNIKLLKQERENELLRKEIKNLESLLNEEKEHNNNEKTHSLIMNSKEIEFLKARCNALSATIKYISRFR